MTNAIITVLAIILFISISANVFAVWYSMRLSRTLLYFSENMNDLLEMLADFSNHVKTVYELETFYGDQVLHNLLKHSQDIVEQIETFDEILYLTEPEEGDQMNEWEEQIEENNTESGAETEEASNPQRVWSGL